MTIGINEHYPAGRVKADFRNRERREMERLLRIEKLVLEFLEDEDPFYLDELRTLVTQGESGELGGE